MSSEPYSPFEQSVLSALDAHIAVLDQNGNITHVNQAWARFAQRNGAQESSTGVGVNYFEVCRSRGATAEVEQILSGIQAVLDGSAPHFQAQYACPSPSETFWFELSVNPLPKPERGVVVCHADISQLRRTRDEYAVVLESARAILWRATLPGFRTTFTSNHAESILGFPAEVWLKSPSLWMDRIHPDDRDWVLAFTGRAIEEQRNHDFEYRMMAADGHIVWLHNIVNVKVEHGRVTEVIGTSVDISERKHAEEALQEINRKLLQAQEQERARIGRELHDDINQRLAMLALELEALREDPAEAGSRVQELRRKTMEISGDVQALSHELHSSKLEYLGIVKGLQSWCKEFAQRQRLEIDFTGELSSVLPHEIGICLFRVLQEALHNAVKHSGAKRIDVRLIEDANEVSLIIHDSGNGFDVEAAMQGHGLGLTSMQERVRLVNGSITIQSSQREGTTIHARVPLRTEHYLQRAAG